ncbi:hypothetical protein [Kibdelosporangium aridum]|uniref:hypothetical protein n=1 Tax=Kibdelosporangium aridum TaxID=2030 RepID=UPI0035E811E6
MIIKSLRYVKLPDGDRTAIAAGRAAHFVPQGQRCRENQPAAGPFAGDDDPLGWQKLHLAGIDVTDVVVGGRERML